MKCWAYADIAVYVIAMILCISLDYWVLAITLGWLLAKRPIRSRS